MMPSNRQTQMLTLMKSETYATPCNRSSLMLRVMIRSCTNCVTTASVASNKQQSNISGFLLPSFMQWLQQACDCCLIFPTTLAPSRSTVIPISIRQLDSNGCAQQTHLLSVLSLQKMSLRMTILQGPTHANFWASLRLSINEPKSLWLKNSTTSVCYGQRSQMGSNSTLWSWDMKDNNTTAMYGQLKGYSWPDCCQKQRLVGVPWVISFATYAALVWTKYLAR